MHLKRRLHDLKMTVGFQFREGILTQEVINNKTPFREVENWNVNPATNSMNISSKKVYRIRTDANQDSPPQKSIQDKTERQNMYKKYFLESRAY